MKEEGISSSGDPFISPNSPPPPPLPPPTAAASSAGASSPAVAINAGSTDWLGHGHGQGSKVGSLSRISSQPVWISLSTSAHGSALGSSQPSCRPWERGDLLRRLSTFRPANWFGKPKVASSLSCARRGWVNVDVDKIQCESCGANLKYNNSNSTPSGEDFGNQLDEGHDATCPWRGNSCTESLVQFPPTPPSALVGGYKDRCDGFLQFPFLPLVATSAIDQMKVSRGPEIDRFLVQSDLENSNTKDVLCVYSRAQKLISLCGWEPRWLPNVQDCEEHSAESAKNGGSFSPIKDQNPKKKKIQKDSSKNESRSPLLDCTLCGSTVRILDFIHVTRPSRLAPNNNNNNNIIDVPETSKKAVITRGTSAASGINGWVEDIDEAATTGMDLNLTMGSGYGQKRTVSDLYLGQAAGSEVGDRAASYESKRHVDEGGSTVDRPHGIIPHTDSIEGGVVIDRDGDEVNDSKRSGAGPSQPFSFDFDRTTPDPLGRTSSVIAMDTFFHSDDDDDNDSMESVENHPGYGVEVNYPSVSGVKSSEEEVLNTDTGKDDFALAVSGGSVGMGASHEAQIRGSEDGLVDRTGSVVGDVEPVTGVTENQGQTGNFVAESQEDSGVNLSCNAVVCSGFEAASRDEVMQAVKSSPTESGPGNGESNFEEAVEFDPIKHHNYFCPWVNGNVAAAGVEVGPTSSSGSGLALCGWQLTLDALDGFQGPEPNQTVESESAASLYKDDHQVSGKKLMARHSFNKSHGQN